MTIRQTVFKFLYPVIMKLTKLMGKNAEVLVNNAATPSESFHSLTAQTIAGEKFSFKKLQGKKVMIVNTASDCGYTKQFDELELLYKKYKNVIEIIAFPSNDFKEQETGNNEAIATFCKTNFGVTFPIMSKSIVTKQSNQNSIYQWLTTKNKNGWNTKTPGWNFAKYLINEQGELTHFFGTAISPLSEEVVKAIEE